MSENIVSVNNLSVSFDYQENFLSKKQKIKAVNNINIKIKKGSFFGLVGESGSGKSTLLNILSTLDNADEGEIIIDGKNIEGNSDIEISKFRNSFIGFLWVLFITICARPDTILFRYVIPFGLTQIAYL